MCVNAKSDLQEYDEIQISTIVVPDSAQDAGQHGDDEVEEDDDDGCFKKRECDVTRRCQSDTATIIVCAVVIYACVKHYAPKFYHWGWLAR